MSRATSFRRLIPAAAALAFGLSATAALAQTAPAPPLPVSKVAPVTKLSTRVAQKSRLMDGAKFSTVAAAQASCPADTVVWSSLTKSRSFHLPGSRYYGKTRHGAYVCEQAALAAGFHRARS